LLFLLYSFSINQKIIKPTSLLSNQHIWSDIFISLSSTRNFLHVWWTHWNEATYRIVLLIVL
jgi:hypothetical protein